MQNTKFPPHEQALPKAQRTARSDLTLASPPGFDHFTYNSVRETKRPPSAFHRCPGQLFQERANAFAESQ